MNKLITTAVALALLTLSTASYSQTEAIKVEPSSSIPLENKYQQELDKWMLQAYEGDRDAQFKVGVLFTNDQFQSADLDQSAYWYKQAARQGHALAQYNLGHLYLTGNGVKRNETEAMKWWLKAAEQDHPLAQFNVGRAYYLGIGLAENHAQSRLWFERAAKNNEPKSTDILEQLGWSKPGEYKSTGERTAATPQIESQTSATNTVLQNSTSNAQDAPSVLSLTAVGSTTVNSIIDNGADVAAQVDRSNPIAVYTNPAKRSVLIAILDARKQLSVVNTTPEWTEVTNENGFPVWVHQNYIDVSDDIGTIKGDAVNARSVPLITNGTVVGQLKNNETLIVLDKKDTWYRIMSPKRFIAWVKTGEFNRKEPLNTANQESAEPASPQAETGAAEQGLSSINDNDWLFSQQADGYTLQLASFDDPAKVVEFKSRKKFLNNPALHSFTSKSKDITWTYFVYGGFASSESAKQARAEIKQELAWVRSFGKLQQNRCVAWKKQIPTPKELNKYCS